jgi:hypothetical protein
LHHLLLRWYEVSAGQKIIEFKDRVAKVCIDTNFYTSTIYKRTSVASVVLAAETKEIHHEHED